MAEGLSVDEANALLTSLATSFTWMQLHVGPPGAVGTANPAIENRRRQVTWGIPSGGAMASTNELIWANVLGTEHYVNFTMWTASTAGTFGFSGVLAAPPINVSDPFTIQAGDTSANFRVAS